MKATVLALAEDQQSETISANTEDSDTDEKNTFIVRTYSETRLYGTRLLTNTRL